MDVYEKVNIILNQQGQLIKSEILGTLKMKTYLTGMPELKLGLNDKMIYDDQNKKSQSRTIELYFIFIVRNDLKFHPCVRLSNFANDRSISFIPPDGEFDLLSYRLDT